MSQIQIFLSVFNSKINSALVAVVVFCRWNSKSHTNFALSFASTVLLSCRCSNQMASWLTSSCCFAQVTALIVSALLFLVRYSLFAGLVHPATRFSTASECWVHILPLPSSVSPLTFFYDFFSTICCNIGIIAVVFPGLRFLDKHTWYSCSCPLYNLLCCSFVLYSLPFWFFTFFLLLLQSIPHWFPSCINQLSIYPIVAFLKSDLYFNFVHCFRFFLYYRILPLGVLSSPCSAYPFVFWAGHVTSNS